MGITPFQTKRATVTIRLPSTRQVVFPKICPHCLRETSTTARIESRERTGYYVVATRWKESSIEVPVCAEVPRRFIIVGISWVSSFLIWLALSKLFGRGINGVSAFLLPILVMTPAGIVHWLLRLNKYIRLVSAKEDSIELEVLNQEYAQALVNANGAKFAWYVV